MRCCDHRGRLARVEATVDGLGEHDDGELGILVCDSLGRRDDERIAVHDRPTPHREQPSEVVDAGGEHGVVRVGLSFFEQRERTGACTGQRC